MNIKRLKTLADFLKTIPTTRFNLSTWRNDTSEDYDGEEFISNLELKSNCNTTACAIGWAGVIPEFISAGFSIRQEENGCEVPCFGRLEEWSAVEEFFDLIPEQARYFFSPSFYPDRKNPKHVIDRIEHVINNGFPERRWNYSFNQYESYWG